MGALDRAVLVGDTAIVARRRHAVIGAQLLIAPGEVLLGLTIEVAERCRQTVAAVLLRHPAQRPQRVLQAFRQRHEALAAEHDMGMLEARERQPEVIEPMTEPLTRDRDAKRAHVSRRALSLRSLKASTKPATSRARTRDGRLPLAGRPIRSLALADGRPRPPARGRDCRPRPARGPIVFGVGDDPVKLGL